MIKFVQRTASLHGGVVRLPFTEQIVLRMVMMTKIKMRRGIMIRGMKVKTT